MQQNDTLKDRFRDFAPSPDPIVWDRIDAELNQKRKKRILFWWTSGTAALVFGFAVLFWVGFFESFSSGESTSNTKQDSVSLNAESVYKEKQETKTIQADSEDIKSAQLPSNSHQTDRENVDSKRHSAHVYMIKSKQNRKSLDSDSSDTYFFNKEVNNTSENLLSEKASIIESWEPLKKLKPRKIDLELNIESRQPFVFLPPSLNSNNPKWQIQLDYGYYFTGLDSNNQTLPAFVGQGEFQDFNSGLTNNAWIEGAQGLSSYRNLMHGFRAGLHLSLRYQWNLRANLGHFRYLIHLPENQNLLKGGSFSQFSTQLDKALFSLGRFQTDIGFGASFGLQRFNQAVMNSSWRSEILTSARISYWLTDNWSFIAEPTARMVFWDSSLGSFGRLSKIYSGLHLGFAFSL